MIIKGEILVSFLLYLAILALGALIGYKNLLNDFLVQKVSMIQNYALLFLLFIMGISIGIDKDVVKYFGVIGYQSIVLAIFTIVFSVLFVKLVSKKVLREEEGVGNDG